jgi:hypothetical protein
VDTVGQLRVVDTTFSPAHDTYRYVPAASPPHPVTRFGSVDRLEVCMPRVIFW